MEAIDIVDSMIADLEKMPNEIAKAVGAEALAYAIAESSGWMSQAELDAAGNPYAKRHGGSLLFPPDKINAQTGQFVQGWDVKVSGRHGVITNPDPNDIVNGNEFMVPRRIDLNVKHYLEAFILPWETQNAINDFNAKYR